MTMLVKKRIQYTVDQAICESAEYIMAKAGLTPATILSMVYAEIANTGKIPVTVQVSKEDFLTAKLIEASYN
ncbi:MAG: damage-inducible protein J, partial [Acinetobacter sp.]